MSLVDDVLTAWEETLFDDAEDDWGAKAYPFILTDGSEAEIEKLSTDGKICFIEYAAAHKVVSREMGSDGSAQQEVVVEVRFTHEKLAFGDPIESSVATSNGYKKIWNFFEDLISNIESDLGPTWGGTVDYYKHQEGELTISETTVAGAQCWRGSFKFIGSVFTEL